MELRWITTGGVRHADLSELAGLLVRTDGFVWLDVPTWSEEAERLLAEVFCFHPMALTNCRDRNHIPLVHVYPSALFIAIHAPEIATGGHVHYLELDQFISERFLVTVHGPLNPVVPIEVALRETRQIAERLEAGRLHPRSPYALTYAIVSAVARREAALTADLARQVGLLEQRVMAAAEEDPHDFLAELFTARHELLTIKTMAAQGGEIYGRAIRLTTFAPREDLDLMRDLLDQYQRVASISQAQLDFLMGVTEFYRARTDTKMTIAAERLAVIAAVTLPVTAISSVMGMNVIVNDTTHWVALGILVSVMSVMSFLVLRWAKRQGWW
ncbi:MAG: putative magnesium and cobalt transporter [Friedmanniella sp.]|jgi:magnesium transporter|nr:putative magnesium and cobalt transporter [Friedmanniella sp.]